MIERQGTLLGLSEELVNKLREFSVAYQVAGVPPCSTEEMVGLLEQVLVEQTSQTGPRLVRKEKSETNWALPPSNGPHVWTGTTTNAPSGYSTHFTAVSSVNMTFSSPDYRIEAHFNIPGQEVSVFVNIVPRTRQIKSTKLHMSDVLKKRRERLEREVSKIHTTAYVSNEKSLAAILFSCFYLNQHYQEILDECNKYNQEYEECYDPPKPVSVYGTATGLLTTSASSGSANTITIVNGTNTAINATITFSGTGTSVGNWITSNSNSASFV